MKTVEEALFSVMGPKSSIVWQGGRIYWGQSLIGVYDFKGTIKMDWTAFPPEIRCSSDLLSFEKAVIDLVMDVFLSSKTNVSILDMNQFIELLILTMKEVRAIEVKGYRVKIKRGHYRFLFKIDNAPIPIEVFRTESGVFEIGHEDKAFIIRDMESLFDAIAKITKTLSIPVEKFLPFED